MILIFASLVAASRGALFVQSCWLCHHRAVLAVDRWSDERACACLRPAHGVHRLRDRRRRRATELAGAGRTGEPDRSTVAVTFREPVTPTGD
jgi:hypothetical protein